MRRLAFASLMLLAAAPAGAAGPARPRLGAALDACHTGALPAERYAVFTGTMPARREGQRMAMRFDLYERRPGARGFARVRLPRWGVWEQTRPGSRPPGFVYSKRVEALGAPADYRAVVRFRWYDGADTVVGRAVRRSPVCHQPDPRPDLRVGDVALAADGRYLVEVRNAGGTGAGAFSMSVAVAGQASAVRVDGVPAGESRSVAVAAARCDRDHPVLVALDTAGEVDEADEADNRATRPCPKIVP